MRCSELREALSARVDGEDDRNEVAIARHLVGCVACTTYAARLADLRELTRPLRRRAESPVPDPAPSLVTSLAGRGSGSRRGWLLRIGIVALALGELLATATEFVSEHGYGGEDHAGHESISFTVALCMGMLWIAWRPSYARSYLPMVGVAGSLLTATAALDLAKGRAHPIDELPHVGLLVAFALLWLLSRDRRGSATTAATSLRAPRAPAARPRLRVVRGALRVVVAVAIPTAVLVAAPSWAHATLEGSNPAQGAILRTAPPAVTIRFDEAVTTLPDSLEVYGPDGARVDDGALTRPGGIGSQVSVGLTGQQRGTYLVSWRVVSADSHPVSGAFTFSVGKATAVPTAPSEHTDAFVATALGASRWLGYAGSALALGGLAFLTLCWPDGWALSSVRRLLWWGLGAGVVAALGGLFLKGPYDAAVGFGHVGQGDLVHEVLGSTYGHGVVARLVLLALLAGLLALRPRVPLRVWTPAALVVGVAMLPTFAVTGHAVSDHPRWLALLVDTIHVGSMSVWLGGLVFMLLCVLRGRTEPEQAHRTARRFSAVALTAVALLVTTGTYQAWRQVGSWAALPATTYGRELLVKLALVAGVIGVAALSRQWVRRGTGALSVLRARVGVEAVGVVLILGLTSALVATQPATSAYRPSVSTTLTLGPDTVRVSAVPAGDRRMDVRLDALDKDGRPTEPAAISASLSLAGQQIGPLPLTLTRAGTGRRTAAVAVPVVGDWTLSVVVRTTAIDEYVKTVTLPIR